MSDDHLHSIKGPALLLAGPGTGKTYRLGKRIKYLVEAQEIPPEEITVVTFTAAAAQNMRDRISDESRQDLYIPHSRQPKHICTMHSFGYRIIRENAGELGFREPPCVIGQDHFHLRRVLVGDAAQLAGYSRAEADATAECRQVGDCRPKGDRKCSICKTYTEILHSCSALDHDEQILMACRFLRAKPEALAKYRSCARHLLVDEYQDINAAQFDFICLLSEGQRAGLFVVGDDDQSIYSWRGGSPEYIRRFKDYFGDEATVTPLPKSFRCHEHILEGALSVVRQFDPERLVKEPFSYKNRDGPRIRIHSAPSDRKEAREIRRIVENALPSQDVLVLFPHKKFSIAIAKELRSNRIPFAATLSVPGRGLPLVSAVASWLANQSNSVWFRQCLEAFLDSPASGIPSSRARKRDKKADREAAFRQIALLWNQVLSGTAASLWESLAATKEEHAILSAAWAAFTRLAELHDNGTDIEAFSAHLANYFSPWRRVRDLMDEASSWVELASQWDTYGHNSGVRLMTLQGAKGLEAKVVCVVGLQEGVIPKESDDDLAEQSRLLFVSMTRAINELHLFYARKRSSKVMLRTVYKKGTQPDLQPSRFLNAIPQGHCRTVFHRAQPNPKPRVVGSSGLPKD